MTDGGKQWYQDPLYSGQLGICLLKEKTVLGFGSEGKERQNPFLDVKFLVYLAVTECGCKVPLPM